jgi:hypothetical protein
MNPRLVRFCVSASRAVLVSLAAAVTPGAITGAQAPAPPSAGESAGSAERCAGLAAARLPDVRMTDVQYVPAAPEATGAVHAAHCRAHRRHRHRNRLLGLAARSLVARG